MLPAEEGACVMVLRRGEWKRDTEAWTRLKAHGGSGDPCKVRIVWWQGLIHTVLPAKFGM